MADYKPLTKEEINKSLYLYMPAMKSKVRHDPNPSKLDPYLRRMALDTFLTYYLGSAEKRSAPLERRGDIAYLGVERREPLKRWDEFKDLLQPILDRAYSHEDFKSEKKGGIRTYRSAVYGNRTNPKKTVINNVISERMQKVLRGIILEVHRTALAERERNPPKEGKTRE